MGLLRTLLVAFAVEQVAGFAPRSSRTLRLATSSSYLAAKLDPETESRRNTILGRDGEHFVLDRTKGRVEFGSSANLVTSLENSSGQSICRWLSDERRVASSIWSKDLMRDMGDSVYQLELMTLQFVTIQLAPRVDVKMWVSYERRTTPSGKPIDIPLFQLQSTSFDPNLQILGNGISAESLRLKIEVVGCLRPTPDGKGVTGGIGFVSSGDLTPPMRLLPEPALRAASDAINRTIKNFAIKSFQEGAVRQYAEFRRGELKERQTLQQ